MTMAAHYLRIRQNALSEGCNPCSGENLNRLWHDKAMTLGKSVLEPFLSGKVQEKREK